MTTKRNPEHDSRGYEVGRSLNVTLTPHFEGTNICTWIGFKHVNYLVEEAILVAFRESGLGARLLFEDYGVGFDIIDIKTRILHALHFDDAVEAQVERISDGQLGGQFKVTMFVDRGGNTLKAVTSKVVAVLRVDDRHDQEAINLPPVFESMKRSTIAGTRAPERVVIPETVAGAPTVTDQVPAELLSKGGKAIMWKHRVPYFYCHHTVRLQMSGLLRDMEEAVDLFLAEHGVSIRTLLDDQDWIPVVPVSHISMVAEAYMEEPLLTVMEVEHVFKRSTYMARIDTYAIRDDELFLVATGTITHGYAVIENRSDWHMIEFDDRLQGALT